MSNKKAFTLIELLIIISIIGILLVAITVSIISVRTRAKDASLKTISQSIQTALVSCCIGSSTLNPIIAANGTICSSGTEKYPGAESISSGSVTAGCNGGNFNVTINAGTKNRGTYSSATIKSDSITYNP